ncbi:flagellar basal body P-ring protein FlgI [bacterium]|nr:flagellar basal body P-ring protein FlgI [bacterium]
MVDTLTNRMFLFPSTRRIFPILFALLSTCLFNSQLFGDAKVRVKDIARVAANRQYQIIGYGLVTGLDGTGDKSQISLEMARGMLQNMGMEVAKSDLQTKNCAAVIVTGMIPPFSKYGETFDVTVSSIGDSSSLQGGVLVPTLLKGGDGQVYAVAQGQISVGGIQSGNTGGGKQKNHPTVGRVLHGAILEREVEEKFGENGTFSLVLSRKDFTVSRLVKEAISRKFGDGWAKTTEPGSVKIRIPESFKDDPVSFAAAIEDLPLSIEEPNRVVINEKTGTIIIGNRVRVSSVVISQGNLRVDIVDTTPTKKPTAAPGKEVQGGLISLQGETTVDDLVKSLNAVGATPKDIISIFQAIDAAGALHGELVVI